MKVTSVGLLNSNVTVSTVLVLVLVRSQLDSRHETIISYNLTLLVVFAFDSVFLGPIAHFREPSSELREVGGSHPAPATTHEFSILTISLIVFTSIVPVHCRSCAWLIFRPTHI